jgi:SAM-dependent methyltransferase
MLDSECNKDRLYFTAKYLLGDVKMGGKRVLDIGGGYGLWSFYAAAAGCAEVICLEPIAEGSTSNIRGKYEHMKDELEEYGSKKVKFLERELQKYEPRSKFDLVISQNSINHIDERACMKIHKSYEAKKTYSEITKKIESLTKKGGKVIIGDASSNNLYNDLGIRNPFAPQIEWNKHCTPETWIKILSRSGLRNPTLRWYTPSVLGKVGRVFSSRIVAYLYTSHYRIKMEKNIDTYAYDNQKALFVA